MSDLYSTGCDDQEVAERLRQVIESLASWIVTPETEPEILRVIEARMAGLIEPGSARLVGRQVRVTKRARFLGVSIKGVVGV